MPKYSGQCLCTTNFVISIKIYYNPGCSCWFTGRPSCLKDCRRVFFFFFQFRIIKYKQIMSTYYIQDIERWIKEVFRCGIQLKTNFKTKMLGKVLKKDLNGFLEHSWIWFDFEGDNEKHKAKMGSQNPVLMY